MAIIDEILSTIGFGLIILALLTVGLADCCKKGKNATKSKKSRKCTVLFAWICALSGVALQIIAIWWYT